MSIFINTCVYCNKRILGSQNIFCLECNGMLPKTYFNFSDNNIIYEKLKHLVKLNGAGSFLFYNNNRMVQHILWEMKYNNNKLLAIEMGRQAAITQVDLLANRFDIIVPIPLHPTKLILRGYNQTDYFGFGFSDIVQVVLDTKILKRRKKTISQTKLNRQDRFGNLDAAFEIDKKEQIKGRKILLIDDVITTGATLVSAAQVLWEAGCSEIGIFTLAIAFDL